MIVSGIFMALQTWWFLFTRCYMCKIWNVYQYKILLELNKLDLKVFLCISLKYVILACVGNVYILKVWTFIFSTVQYFPF